MNLFDFIRNNNFKVQYKMSNFVPATATDEEIRLQITSLDCSNWNLTEIPSLPECVILDCSLNPIKNLPASLPACKVLNCSKTDINLLSFKNIPNCISIDFSFTKIKRCDIDCKKIICTNTPLRGFTSLNNCVILDCSETKITSLPDLPKCINLNCENCRLTDLPALPNAVSVNCSGNSIKTIKGLDQCIFLSCNSTECSSLRNLPKCQVILCRGNYIGELPESLPACKFLNCEFNVPKIQTRPSCLPKDCIFTR